MNLKPISQIASKYAEINNVKSLLQTKPAGFSKINMEGLKVLKKDTLVLFKKPKKFNSQAERLKDYYESKGVPFLLPHQEYSDKKIADTIELFGKDIDTLIKNKQLNKETAQIALEKLAAETKGKIEIKDFVDFENDMKGIGISEDRIKLHLLTANATTVSNFNQKNVTVYINFEKAKDEGNAPLFFKREIKHEVTHALTDTLQNNMFIQIYKNNIYKTTNQQNILILFSYN